ncbi:MAG: lipopolysaccharide kinase InaA family protein [Sedimentisphaeraceae bacterium JB056]
MKADLKVHSVDSVNTEFIRDAAYEVFDRYTGQMYKWKLVDDDKVRKISMGGRACVLEVNVSGKTCCVKFFYDDRFYVKLRNKFGFPKARRAFEKGLELQRRNINCPKMLGWALDSRSSLALIVTELVNDADQIDRWLAENELTKDFIKALADFLRGMHSAAAGHNDLSLRNIMVGVRDDEFVFYLLDYEDAVFYSHTSEKQILKDLHHINERILTMIDIKDRLYFLKCYFKNDRALVRVWAKRLREYMKKNPSKYSQMYFDCK